MPDTIVRYQPTPNPNAGKFIVSRKVVAGASSKSFYNAADAAAHPLAAALFELEGVASLFMVDDFVTVTKSGDADWNELIPKVQATIEQALR
jgi:NFU1 iron-sulfur cluster scaffold homolog, mitochondrial